MSGATRVAALLVSSALLFGCAANTVDTPSTPEPEPASRAAVPEGWQSLTFAQLEAMHYTRIEKLADSLQQDMPSGVKLREFRPESEWAASQVSCLSDQGFDAEVFQGGVRLGVVPDEQIPALKQSMLSCEIQYAVDPRVAAQPLPLSVAKSQYDHWVSSMACIRAQGYEPEQPPALEVWLAEYYNEKVEFWNPFRVADDPVELNELQLACPVTPEDLYPPIPARDN